MPFIDWCLRTLHCLIISRSTWYIAPIKHGITNNEIGNKTVDGFIVPDGSASHEAGALPKASSKILPTYLAKKEVGLVVSNVVHCRPLSEDDREH